MAFTLSQLQTELQNHGYGTDTAAAQTTALNAALRDVRNYRRWPWNEGSGTVAMVIGISAYTPPIAQVEPDSIRIVIGTEGYDLDYLDPDDMLDLQVNNPLQGIPQYWTYHNQQLLIYPSPDRAYTATVQYQAAA